MNGLKGELARRSNPLSTGQPDLREGRKNYGENSKRHEGKTAGSNLPFWGCRFLLGEPGGLINVAAAEYPGRSLTVIVPQFLRTA
jgi:hypothetical protein